MPRFNVVMTAPRLAPRAVSVLERAGCAVHFTPPYPSAAEVARLVAKLQADAVLARQGPVDEAVMLASRRLRIVARHGVGVDNVDLEAAARSGVIVTRAPGSNTQAVAEHTLAVLLAMLKDLRPLAEHVASGNWRDAATQVRDAAGLRLGLVGFGAIGRAVARLAEAFGMEVRAYDPAASTGPLAPSLSALLAESEAVSLHCPLTLATRHLIGRAEIAAMPPGGFLVNTARGGLIDEAALLEALDAGHLAGAALDVTEREPPDPASPLRSHPRVILTPHVAGVTPASLDRMGTVAAECIAAVLTGATVPVECLVPLPTPA